MMMSDFSQARQAMINGQLTVNRVNDQRVLEAMAAVEREKFVPKSLRHVAYIDEDLPVGDGRYLMEPMVFARLLNAAELRDGDVVLDIGCLQGYSSAVLARLATTIVALEADEPRAQAAEKTLRALGVDNVAVTRGPLRDGVAGEAPYDAIFIEGAVEAVPPALFDQLKEGACLMTVMMVDGVGKASLFRKTNGEIGRRSLFDASTPLLEEFAAVPEFRF